VALILGQDLSTKSRIYGNALASGYSRYLSKLGSHVVTPSFPPLNCVGSNLGGLAALELLEAGRQLPHSCLKLCAASLVMILLLECPVLPEKAALHADFLLLQSSLNISRLCICCLGNLANSQV